MRFLVAALALGSIPACSASGGASDPPSTLTGGSGGTGAGSGLGAVGGAGAMGGTPSTGGSFSFAGSGNAAAGGTGARDTCGSVQLEATVQEVQLPGNVLVIFDQSRSMTADYDTPSGPQPRWQAASEAVASAIEPVQDLLTVGSIVFPTSSALALCSAIVDAIEQPSQINFRPGRDFVQAWRSYWAAGEANLVLGTPINRAFDAAAGGLSVANLQGRIVVIVVGDGEPVCLDGMPADQRAAEWLALGIQTYVIGLPDSSIAGGAPLLSSIALNGGTTDFISPADSATLTNELSQIAANAITTGIDDCVITLEPPPEDPDQTFLVVAEASTGQRFDVPRDDGAGNGWTLNADATQATLTGAVCDEARQGRFSTVTFEFGCVELPPLIR
jgi:hypothetical protein